ncbi:glycosyltransferase family 2 protein [Candidatus Pacearchaeota archaeon]|nr:glycosyltransferase family 2 protein [Candidatus Pacearchaeota archaeon]
MAKLPKLSLIIPVYNEGENIIILYSELKQVIKELINSKIIGNYEIIFINDGSKDNTQAILEEINKIDKHLKFVQFRRNFGQTPALKAGFDFCTGDLIVTMDGDLQNDARDIPRLIKKLQQGYDVVSGWRFKRKDTLFKKLSSQIMNNLRRRIIGDHLHDYGCSLKIYKKECIKDLELFGELHRYITAYLYIKGYEIGELPVNHRLRKFGKTKYTFKRGLNGILDLFYLKFWATYSNKPLHFFGRIGFYQWILAFLILIEQIIKANIVKALELGPLLMLAAVLGISGLLFIVFGFLSEVITRSYYKDIKIYNIRKKSE